MMNELIKLARDARAEFDRIDGVLNELEADSGVSFCAVGNGRMAELHVYSGIETLAAEVCAKVELHPRSDSDYPYEYDFTHDGVRFFQISKSEVPE